MHPTKLSGRFPVSFVHSRWSGRIPLSRLLWTDMLLHGTTVNIVAALAGLLLLAQEAPTALGASVYFAPLPYNLFLLAALWRAAARAEEPFASAARVVGIAWFAVMLVL